MARGGKQPGLAQFLNYRRPVAPGIIENHDGAFLTAFAYAGPDQEYAEYSHMAWVADQLNHELAKLGNGWMLETQAMRVPLSLPVTSSHCPDATSALIFAERGQRYAESGRHYETRLVFTLTYLPPSGVRRRFSELFFGTRRKNKKQSRRDLLAHFQTATEQIAAGFSRLLTVERLDDKAIVHFLRYCVTGDDRAVNLPADARHLPSVIGNVPWDLSAGRIGEQHVRVVGVTGFPTDGTTPQMLAPLLTLPFLLRLAQRFIFLSPPTAAKELSKKYADFVQLNAYNLKRIVFSVLQHVLKTDPNDEDVVARNKDAEAQKDSVQRAITEVQGGTVRSGYYTPVVVTYGKTAEEAQARAYEVVATVNALGFTGIIETDNAKDAIGGSWPGHGERNVRQPTLNTRHVAQLWPISMPWLGEKQHPCSYYPPNSGPLLVTTTTGNTPYFFNTHVGQLGNFGIIGPSGAGKTVLFDAIAMGHRQYDRSQIHIFDRDAGSIVPTLACGGEFFDLDALHFAPLAHIDEEEERAWALWFLEHCATLRDFPMTPAARVDIERALRTLSSAPRSQRTMTVFLGLLQTHEAGLKEALSFYTLGSGGAMLDGEPGAEQEQSWLTYDMEKLLARGPAVSTPVLAYVIHHMGRRMDGRPTLVLFDEGWMSASDILLRDYIEESSATNRKKVTSLGLVLHSPGDLATFPRKDLLLANLATLIFLPNEKAQDAALRPHYEALGLNGREIRMLAEEMHPQQDYYCVQGKNRRRFQLQLGPFEKAILAVNGRDHRQHILTLQAEYGHNWLSHWLTEQGHSTLR